MIKNGLKIRCFISNSINICKSYIKIFNSDDVLIDRGYTDNLGYFYFTPPFSDVYKVVAYSNCGNIGIISRYVYINKNVQTRLLLDFYDNYSNDQETVYIRLTDKNYKDLPIEKGELILWQKNT